MMEEIPQDAIVTAVENAEPVPSEAGPGETGTASATNIQADIDRLARMKALEYEQVREAEAKRLGVRKSVLDEARGERQKEIIAALYEALKPPSFLQKIEPWQEPVDGAALLDAMAVAIRKYIALPQAVCAYAMALWALHAHAHDAAFCSPLLAFVSPQKRCGKTRALEIVSRLTPRSLPVANISPSALFRVTERDHPTLFIDEADTFLKAAEELRGILNSGHTRTSAFVLRNVEEDGDYEPRQFSTWAPKAVALIGKLPDTLEDRSIVISLRRKLRGEKVTRFRADRAGDLTELQRKAARWAADNFNALKAADPEVPAALNDRAADNWRALIAIADQAGGVWPKLARDAALALSDDDAEDRKGDYSLRLLADCREVFDDEGAKALTPARLRELLVSLEEAPWAEMRQGRPISPDAVALMLKDFSIKSCEPTRSFCGGKKQRYYIRDDFEDSWARYLSADEKPSSSVPAENTSHVSRSSHDEKIGGKSEVYDGAREESQRVPLSVQPVPF
jgi:putative DNA primase/helicase